MRIAFIFILISSTLLKSGEFHQHNVNDKIPEGRGLHILADSALFTRALDFCGELKNLVESGTPLSFTDFNGLVLEANVMVKDPLVQAPINYYLACLSTIADLENKTKKRFFLDFKGRLENNLYGRHYLNLLNRHLNLLNRRYFGVPPERTEPEDSFSDSDYSSSCDSLSDGSSSRFMPKRVHFPDLLAQVREVTPYSDSSGDNEFRRIRSPGCRWGRNLNISIPKTSGPRLDQNGEIDLTCHLSDEE